MSGVADVKVLRWEEWLLIAAWGPRAADPEGPWRDLVTMCAAIEESVPAIENWLDDRGRALCSAMDEDSWEYWADYANPTGDDAVFSGELAATDDLEEHGGGSFEITVGSEDPYEPNGMQWLLMETGRDLVGHTRRAAEVLDRLVRATSPDWAGIYPPDYLSLQAEIRTDGPHIGWITYLSASSDMLPRDLGPDVDTAFVHEGRRLTSDLAGGPDAIRRLSTTFVSSSAV